jgi:hypothetical protein
MQWTTTPPSGASTIAVIAAATFERNRSRKIR